MRPRHMRLMATLVSLVAVPAMLAGSGAASAGAATAKAPDLRGQFVKRVGGDLYLGGKPWKFSGTNNYYPMYKSQVMVDALLEKTAASGFQTLRIWASHDVGDPITPTTDNTSPAYSIDSPADEGVYLQYWDPAAGRPVYNDGANGMERLDHIVAKAQEEGVRLVMPLVNNWNNFGGMDQYVQWAGKQYHDDFYTDPQIRTWYKEWISHILNRTNSITGVKYKDDPTILMWELGNEPRCLSAGAKPRSPNCTTDTLVTWADEMTTHIKSIDKKHLAGVGDEGFYAKEAPIPGSTTQDWTRTGGEGVDTIRFAALKNVDVMSFHLYPNSWGKDATWATNWIIEHVKDAKKLGKVSYLGEFGWLDKTTRNPIYQRWLDAFRNNGGDGWAYWILSDVQDDGSLYPDYDGFTVYCPSPVCTTMGNESKLLRREATNFPPTADVDTVTTEFNTAATLTVLANDVTWNGRRLVPATVDLDPATAGIQNTRTVTAGVFRVAKGIVTFTPATDFVGRATASYTVRDSSAQRSNEASITAFVKPDPTAAVPLGTFEEGTDGWTARNWNGTASSVAQSTDWFKTGASSLKVISAGDWFGIDYSTPLNLSTKSIIKLDLKTTPEAGSSVSIALQTGADFTFCQGPFNWYNPDGVYEVSVDLLTGLGCEADLTDVRAINVFFNAGTYYIDDVRAE